MKNKSVIISAKRTPIGSFLGHLSSFSASDLASHVIKNILDDVEIESGIIDEVILGNVLSAGQGQAPARQATIKSGCPNHIEALTINKMCGSGLKAVMLADQMIRCGDSEIILAGGMESMSNAPYLIQELRSGKRLGHTSVIDTMIYDGLWDAYTDKHMGNFAEMLAKDRNYSREDQDSFAVESYKRAKHATDQGIFSSEIVPMEIKKKSSDTIVINEDEEPSKVKYEKISNLKPAFQNDGTITAANASKINDGAAVLLIVSEKKARDLGIKPLASILAHASFAHEPEWFTTAPAQAITKVLKKTNLKSSDIDLWEINEAFAVVALAAMDDFNIQHEKMNIYGGAVALGHPIGASGARILTTLLNGMHRNKSHLGLATLCIGGGEASALIIERND